MWNISVAWWEFLFKERSSTVALWEFVLRGIIIYAFLIIILRMTGKRQIGQMSPFDLVLLLVLSNAVQNSMNGGDNSIIGGMILAATLVTINWLVGALTYKSKRAETLIEGKPELLIHNGKLFETTLAKSQLTRHELDTALREAGCCDIDDVHVALLENDGKISVLPKRR
jgi:uncharacterized membrane protein YcaP (DUF421 family)